MVEPFYPADPLVVVDPAVVQLRGHHATALAGVRAARWTHAEALAWLHKLVEERKL